MRFVQAIAALIGLAIATPRLAAQDTLVERARYSIEVPSTILTDVPVPKIVIRALNANGDVDASYSEQPLVTGIRLALPDRDDATLGAFHAGVLELTTDLRAGRKVYVSDSEVVVNPGDRHELRVEVRRTSRWLCLAPALIACILCVWPRKFVFAIFVAVFCGTAILVRGDLPRAFSRTMDTFVTAAASGSHLTVFATLMFFGSLYGVISASGGLSAAADRMRRIASTRERGEFLTLVLGLIAFFDDYAHALIVGKTLRPLSDRLKIPREKLAFLVDATCAPVAALAVASTWLAAESAAVRDAFAGFGLAASPITILVASFSYSFYPVLILIFAALVVVLGHDFGPMLRAEWRVAAHGTLSRDEQFDAIVLPTEENDDPDRRKWAGNLWLPLLILVASLGIGIWWTGTPASVRSDDPTSMAIKSEPAWLRVIERADPPRALLFSSFFASVAAVASAVALRSLSLQQGMYAWVAGMQRVVPAGLMLIASWSFVHVCDADHLNIAGFLMEIGQPHVTVEWMPLVAFLAVGITSLVVGSAWTAIPLAMPLFITLTCNLLLDLGEAGPMHPILLGTIGAVIAGAVFGRHCSPISETTVLASASSACSHLDHVFTQLPYAMTVAIVAAIFGYIPVAYGYSPVALLPLCTAVLFSIIQFGGRPGAQKTDDGAAPADAPHEEAADAAEAPDGRRAGAASGKPRKEGAPPAQGRAPARA